MTTKQLLLAAMLFGSIAHKTLALKEESRASECGKAFTRKDFTSEHLKSPLFKSITSSDEYISSSKRIAQLHEKAEKARCTSIGTNEHLNYRAHNDACYDLHKVWHNFLSSKNPETAAARDQLMVIIELCHANTKTLDTIAHNTPESKNHDKKYTEYENAVYEQYSEAVEKYIEIKNIEIENAQRQINKQS